MIKVHDNLFDYLYVVELANRMLLNMSWKANNLANRYTYPYELTGTHRLLGNTLFLKKSDTNIDFNPDINFTKEIMKHFDFIRFKTNNKDLDLREIMCNLQFVGMDGTLHTDGGNDDISFILMLCNDRVPPDSGGEFCHDATKQKIPFVNGRLIEITASDLHCGLAFNKPSLTRLSIKWTGKKIQ
jgi:hypothetical protein